MKKPLLLWLIVFFVLSFSESICQDWRNLYGNAVKLYENNDFKASYTEATKALDVYLKESGELSENYASILRLLENICYADNDFKQGLEYANKEVTIRAKSKDVAYAGALSQQGMFLQALEDYKNADRSFRESLEILNQFHKAGDFEVIEAKVTVAVNAYLGNELSEAEQLFNETLNLNLESISPVFIQAFYFNGIVHQEKGDFETALKNFSQVEAYYATLEPSIEYARLLTSIGQCYHSSLQWDKAENSYAKAATIFDDQKVRDGDHLTLLNARAVNYQQMGQTEKAEKLLSDLSGVKEPKAVAALLSNKAALSAGKGDYKTAEQSYRQALSKLDKGDKNHMDLYCEILYNLGNLQDEMSNPDEAEKLFAESETLLESKYGAKSFLLVPVKVGRANIYTKMGQFDRGLKSYAEILSIIKADGKQRSAHAAKAMSGLAALFYKKGEILKSDSVFRDLLAKYNSGEFQRSETYATILNNYAAVKQTKGEYAIARKLFREAAGFMQKTYGVYNIGYTRALENLGYIDVEMGSLTAAKTEIDSALFLYEKLLGQHSLSYGMALISKGKYHQNAGEYTLAEPYFRKAYRLVSESKDATEENWIKAANALAVYYQTMGNYEQAEPLLKQIRTRIESTSGKNTAEYSTTLQNLATLYQLQEKLDLAGPLLEEALAVDKKIYGDEHPRYIIALRNLAAVYQKTGKRDNARILLELALTSTKNTFGEDHPAYATTLSNLASLYQDMGKMKEAEKAWTQSVALRKKLLGDQHPDYARSLYGLATVYFGQGKLAEANEYYKLVVAQYLKQISEYFPALSEKEKGAFYQKIKPVFDSYQDFCIQFHKKNPADKNVLRELYRTQLITKAILLNASNKVRQTILSSGDTSLVNVFRKWLGVKEQIVHHYSLSAEERKQFATIDELRRRANDLEKQLSANSALFRSQFVEKEYSAGTISGLLKTQEAAIEILRIQRKFVKDSIYYVALVLKNGSDLPSLVIWPYGQKLENRFFRFHRNAIKYHIRDTISYNYYWKPLSTELKNVRKLYLSADGIFNKINFNIIQNNVDHHWVLDDYEIHLLSNTKEIVEHAARKPSPNSGIHLYGYADFHLKLSASAAVSHKALNRSFGFDDEIPMLPGTQVEIDEIGKLLESKKFKVASYKTKDASETNIKKTPKVKVLHIATHGFFMNDVEVSESEGDDREDFFNNPLLRSGILLSGAGVTNPETDLSGEDGILTAYEAMNIDLNETDLVVLSACETALGELKNGEGVYGLQRSFIVAGAGAVMMSLWQVDDVATQELMVSFYKHWLDGQQKHEAFRNAQLSIKEKYPSPFYWGAFILVGQ
jgi:CHAT domain-containing protein